MRVCQHQLSFLLFTGTPFVVELPISHGNIYAEGAGVQVVSQGGGPSPAQFWGSFVFLHKPFDEELPNFTR